MANPIQRAGEHLYRKIVIEGADSDVFALAQLVFESIDVDDLAAVILAHYQRSDGLDVTAIDTAEAVKAHLTGKREGGAD